MALVRKFTVTCAYCKRKKQIYLKEYMRNTTGLFFCNPEERYAYQKEHGGLKE
jgi:hypothetical protein